MKAAEAAQFQCFSLWLITSSYFKLLQVTSSFMILQVTSDLPILLLWMIQTLHRRQGLWTFQGSPKTCVRISWSAISETPNCPNCAIFRTLKLKEHGIEGFREVTRRKTLARTTRTNWSTVLTNLERYGERTLELYQKARMLPSVGYSLHLNKAASKTSRNRCCRVCLSCIFLVESSMSTYVLW